MENITELKGVARTLLAALKVKKKDEYYGELPGNHIEKRLNTIKFVYSFDNIVISRYNKS